jgi:hypothetical protein
MKFTVILYIPLGICFGTAILVPMTNAAFVCDLGWSLFRGNCYKVNLYKEEHKSNIIN